MVINPIVGVYISIIIRIPIKGGMTIPNIATFDHGTYVWYCHCLVGSQRFYMMSHAIVYRRRLSDQAASCCLQGRLARARQQCHNAESSGWYGGRQRSSKSGQKASLEVRCHVIFLILQVDSITYFWIRWKHWQIGMFNQHLEEPSCTCTLNDYLIGGSKTMCLIFISTWRDDPIWQLEVPGRRPQF